MPLTYADVLGYLNRFVNYEKRPNVPYGENTYKLDRVRALLARLGDPQTHYPSVIIAGTKGKGSTAALIEAGLRAAGLRTGFYSSPHLHTFRERIRLDGNLISESTLARLLETTLQPVVAAMEATDDPNDVPTYYELCTALAFLAFAEMPVDIAVLEVGLGGRLDATNVVTPVLSVITPISYDHMAVLGNTLGEIAGEKAGIIKRGGLALTTPQPAEAATVIARVAAQQGARLVQADEVVQAGEGDGRPVQDRAGLPVGRDLHLILSNLEAVSGQTSDIRLRLPLLGGHQVTNAHTAAAALVLLREHGPDAVRARLGEEWDRALVVGFGQVEWPGRLEIVGHDPLLVVDGAHNGESAQRLREALGEDFGVQGQGVVYVFGLNADKDGPAIVHELAPLAAHAVLSPLHSPRTATTGQLAELWQPYGVPVTEVASVAEALTVAAGIVRPEGARLVCATGSLYLVGEARAAVGLSLGDDPL